MDLYVVTAVVSLAVAALIVGSLLLYSSAQVDAPPCSDCSFCVRGPVSLIQTNASAYLVRGTALDNSSLMAQYAKAHVKGRAPLAPGEALTCARAMCLDIVDGVAYASCVGS